MLVPYGKWHSNRPKQVPLTQPANLNTKSIHMAASLKSRNPSVLWNGAVHHHARALALSTNGKEKKKKKLIKLINIKSKAKPSTL